MTEPIEETIDVAAQVRRHLESLRAAGVDWLPASAPTSRQGDKETRRQGDEETRRQDGMPSVGTRGGAEPPVISPTSPCLPVSLSPYLLVSDVPAAAPLEQRRRELQMLAERVSGCMRCKELASTRTQTVFGVGRIDPDLCFLGEAPGFDEDATGEPFVGKAGQLLTQIIGAMGLKREEVYICNILRCRPPQNRQPLPQEAANCREYLEQTLELVRPKCICALGASAAKYLLQTSVGITRLRGKWTTYRDIPVMCTYHPSFLLRVPEKKRDVWEDMKLVLTRMGKPIPRK